MQKYIIIMARKPLTNLEKVSEKNEMSVEVFPDNRYSKFTHSFKIPFKELESDISYVSIFKVIDTFSDVIIQALEKRMESCMNMLSRNLFNVVESNEYHVLFKKEDGSYHSFNHLSFEIMQETVYLLEKEKSDCLEKRHYAQILKALYWVEKPAPRKGVSFGNLISVCIERLCILP